MATKKGQTIIYLQARSERNFSGGTMRKIQNSVAPVGTYTLALNMDSNEEIGSLVSRLGTSIVGEKKVGRLDCWGIGNYNKTDKTKSKLFAAFYDGSTHIRIEDMVDGTSGLVYFNPNYKVRFVNYLDSIMAFNGTQNPAAFDGTSWSTISSTFDLTNIQDLFVAIEWKDRIYGATKTSDKLLYSSIADPTARTISWTDTSPISGAGYLMISQEDGGGGITALAKVPGYLLIFKNRTMKRWDGSTTFPEDLVNQGVPTQECVTYAKEYCYFINQKGIWVTNGGYPVRISRSVQDFIDNIADFNNVNVISDDEHVYFSLGDVRIGLETYSNVVLKYALEDKTWDVRSYFNEIKALGSYVDGNEKRWLVIGDNQGQTLVLNSGNTDYDATSPKAIMWSLETHQIDFGVRRYIKKLQKLVVHTENVSAGKVLWRNKNLGGSYKQMGLITGDVSELENPEDVVGGNYVQLKFTGSNKNERIKFLGYEFPESSIIVNPQTIE